MAWCASTPRSPRPPSRIPPERWPAPCAPCCTPLRRPSPPTGGRTCGPSSGERRDSAMTERRRLLLVTNDFPPRQGGIQTFLWELLRRLPADQVAVYCSTYPGAPAFDAELPFPVRRHPTGLLVPSPAARRRVLQARADFGASSVWFGAAAPL